MRTDTQRTHKMPPLISTTYGPMDKILKYKMTVSIFILHSETASPQIVVTNFNQY